MEKFPILYVDDETHNLTSFVATADVSVVISAFRRSIHQPSVNGIRNAGMIVGAASVECDDENAVRISNGPDRGGIDVSHAEDLSPVKPREQTRLLGKTTLIFSLQLDVT